MKHPASGRKVGTQDRDHRLGAGDPGPGEHCLRRRRAGLLRHPRRRLPEAVREGERAAGPAPARPRTAAPPTTARPAARGRHRRTTSRSRGTGQFVTIDAGTDDGVAPGNVFSIYRVMYPSVPTPRNVARRGGRRLGPRADRHRQVIYSAQRRSWSATRSSCGSSSPSRVPTPAGRACRPSFVHVARAAGRGRPAPRGRSARK